MPLTKLIFAIYIVCLTCNILIGQVSSYKNYDVNDGLPASAVYRIQQDDSGLMWFATENGLCSFDGHEFENVKSSLYNNSEMINMQIDSSGRVWHSNLIGELFYLENKKVYKFSDPKLPLHKVVAYKLPKDKLVVLYQDDGVRILKAYTFENKNQEEYFTRESLSATLVSFHENVYLSYNGTSSGSFELEKISDKELIESYKYNLRAKHLIAAASEKLLFSVNTLQDSLYLLSDKKVLDRKKLDFYYNRLKVIGTNCYLLTYNGIRRLRINNQKIEIDNDVLFEGLKVLSLHQDMEGNYWIGTANSGVFFVPNLEAMLFNKSNSILSSNYIRTVSHSQNKDLLYVGLDNGEVFKMNKNQDIKSVQKFGIEVNKILEDKENDRLWVATNKSLSIYSLEDKSVVSQKGTIKDIFLSSNGEALIAMSHANYVFNADVLESQLKINNNFQFTNNSQFTGLTTERSYAVNIDKKNNYWVGCINGLYVFSKVGSEFKIDTLLAFNVSDIEFDNNGIAYVGTFQKGLFKFEAQNLVEHYHTKNKLTTDRISDIYIDSSTIYISTDKGLNILNSETNNIRFMNRSDGIISDNINQTVVDSDHIWLATNKGLCQIPKQAHNIDLSQHKVKVSTLTLSNVDTTIQNHYQLESDNRKVNIDYYTTSYKLLDHTIFHYRLIGLDSSWQTTKNSTIRFSQLPYGKSEFQIYASDRNTNKKTEVTSMTFDIATPLKYKLWFRLLVILSSILALIYLWSRYLTSKHKREREELINNKKITGLKLTALQNHMNPHFISNAILTIQNLHDKKDRWAASSFTSKFAKLVRSSMHLSTLERISLSEEIEFLHKYVELEQMRFDQNITTEIIIDDGLRRKTERIKVPPLLIQPLVENVFKHAGLEKNDNAKLQISFFDKDRYLVCQVTDNGIGIENENKKDTRNWKNSTGINTIEKRLILNAQQLNIIKPENKLIEFKSEKLSEDNRTTVSIKIYYP